MRKYGSGFGIRGTFTCDSCGRLTRETPAGNVYCCSQCYELAGIQNGVWDGDPLNVAERDRLTASLVKLGVSEMKVRREFPDLWP